MMSLYNCLREMALWQTAVEYVRDNVHNQLLYKGKHLFGLHKEGIVLFELLNILLNTYCYHRDYQDVRYTSHTSLVLLSSFI